MNDYFIANAISAWIPNLQYEIPYLGLIDITNLVSAAVIFSVLTLAFWILRQVILNRLRTLSEKTDTESDDMVIEAVQSIHGAVYTLVALYFALQMFTFPTLVDQIISGIFYVVLTWQVIRIVSTIIRFFVNAKLKKSDGDEVDPNAATAADMVTLIAKITLWVLGIIFVLSNLGIEVTSLIAGLGIGGVAIAFALQGILGDLFASFSIYFDKPFRVGDFILIGSDAGVVERIGIKSTRIRTLQGEELVVSNAELTTARVQNFKKMENRRVVTNFGVTYETAPEKLEKIKTIVADIFEKHTEAKLDRVFFTTFGDSALQYEVVYFVHSSDYVEFLKAQETFNLCLFRRFAEEGIEFAYPTQVIYTKSS